MAREFQTARDSEFRGIACRDAIIYTDGDDNHTGFDEYGAS